MCKNRISTGHLDRKGRMIHRHDRVDVTLRPHYINTDYDKAPTRPAHILWVGGVWLLRFGDGTTEPLNHYSQNELLNRS